MVEELLGDEEVVLAGRGVGLAHGGLDLDVLDPGRLHREAADLHHVHDAVGESAASGFLEDELGGAVLDESRVDRGARGGPDGADDGLPGLGMPCGSGEQPP